MVALNLCMVIAVMLFAWRLLEHQNNPGYSCPQCGARSQDEHKEDCSWG